MKYVVSMYCAVLEVSSITIIIIYELEVGCPQP